MMKHKKNKAAQGRILLRYITAALCSVACCCSAAAQNDSLRLKGTLSVSKAGHYSYLLVLGDRKGQWSGYSILDPGGPSETKSTAGAQFSKEKGAMIFSEKELVYTKAREQNFCFIGAVLKINARTKDLSGFFAGKDAHNKACGTGTLKFFIPEAVKPLLTPDGAKDTNMIMPLTKLNTETFQAAGKQVSLEIWDRGIEDHDSIAVYLNDRLLEPAFEIKGQKRHITIDLQKGKNILKVRAINEGDEKPNSARIELYDKGSRLSLASFLKEGEEARVEIIY